MANEYTTTIEYELGGEVYTLTPTVESIVEYESRSGETALSTYMLWRNGKGVPLKILSLIVWSGIYGHESRAEKPKIVPSWVEIAGLLRDSGKWQTPSPELMLWVCNWLSSEKQREESKKKAQQEVTPTE